jgi:hypothetical protein
MPPKTKRGMWTNEMLEITKDVIERGTHSVSSITHHLNGKTRFKKMGPKGVLREKKDVVMKWTLDM